MNKDLTLLEIIGIAIRSEEDAAEFYGSISKVIKNRLVRDKYESLAREETGHRHILVEMYKKMTGENSAPPKIPGSPKTAEGEHVKVSLESMEELLKLAIKREQGACDFYRKAAGRSVDGTGKRTLDYLADIERGHGELLKNELDSYLKDRDWYADNPDIQLVGP